MDFTSVYVDELIEIILVQYQPQRALGLETVQRGV